MTLLTLGARPEVHQETGTQNKFVLTGRSLAQTESVQEDLKAIYQIFLKKILPAMRNEYRPRQDLYNSNEECQRPLEVKA